MRALAPNGSSTASNKRGLLTLITPMRRRDQSQYYMPIRQFYECQTHNQAAEQEVVISPNASAVSAVQASSRPWTGDFSSVQTQIKATPLVLAGHDQAIHGPPQAPASFRGCPAQGHGCPVSVVLRGQTCPDLWSAASHPPLRVPPSPRSRREGWGEGQLLHSTADMTHPGLRPGASFRVRPQRSLPCLAVPVFQVPEVVVPAA